MILLSGVYLQESSFQVCCPRVPRVSRPAVMQCPLSGPTASRVYLPAEATVLYRFKLLPIGRPCQLGNDMRTRVHITKHGEVKNSRVGRWI